MAIYVNIFISIFSLFFSFSNMILSDAFILPVSQLQTQQVMTSQIRSHIEYSIQTYYILVLETDENIAIMAGLFKLLLAAVTVIVSVRIIVYAGCSRCVA